VRRRTIALLTLAVVGALWLPGETKVDGQAQNRGPRVVALRGGTVYTVTKGTIPNGTVVLRDGKIAAVGANVEIPAGAEVVDVTGKHITPGIIDAHSHIAVDGINEGGTTVSSMTGMEDVLNPTDVSIYRDLAGGLTVANVLHGSANPIGGKNAVIKLRWGAKRAQDLLFEGAMPGIKFALGENPKDMTTGQVTVRRYPMTRQGVEYVIRDAFTRARAYQRSWQAYEKAKGTNPDAIPPRRDLQLEPLVEIMEGKRLVHCHTYRADETLMMMRVAEEFGFKIATFQHVLEGYKVAKEMAAHGAGGSTFADWWGYKIEADDAIPHNAAIMVRKGVLVSINSDSAEHARRLNTEAAKTMRWGGLSEDEALALVTINPAKQLRIDNKVGSLEVGKDGDVAVWTHHPLSSYAIADRVYIDGREYYNRLGEETRLTELRKERSALAAAERAGRGGPTGTQQQDERRGEGDDSRGPNAGNGTNGSSAAVNHLPAPLPVPQAPAQGAVLAITNARIFPVTAAPIENGTIVIRGNRIEAVGANLQVPQGAKVIDAKGGHVYPGFINARTTIGIGQNGARGFDDISEMLDWNQQLRTRVAYHSESDTIAVARGTGVTTVGVAPTGGIMSGEFAVMNLDGWTWEEATLRQNAGIAFNFPALAGGGGRGGGGGGGGGRGGRGGEGADRTYDDVRRERDRRVDEVIRVLDQARAYAKAGKDKPMNWELEALVPVVERRIPLLVSVAREQDIKDAVAFSERAGVNIVLSGAVEANYTAQLLKDKNIAVILGNILAMPSREDNFHASTYQLAGELAKAGVKFAFSSGDNQNVRLAPFQAAMSVAWGLDRDKALRALTIDAAEILGVGNRIGSIEAGKDANLFIASGDPLEIRNQVTHVIIQGKDVGMDNKHEALYRKYIARP
jgi:imidazolonepropionase-like amidohydrolase